MTNKTLDSKIFDEYESNGKTSVAVYGSEKKGKAYLLFLNYTLAITWDGKKLTKY